MRPCRAIPIDGKDFVYGWYFERGKDAYIINNEGFLHPHIAQPPLKKGPMVLCLTEEHFIEAIPETVGQQIGIPDKNKKEIYAGDEIEYCCDKRYEVVWDSCAYYKLRSLWEECPDWQKECLDFAETAHEELEIIGTIHDELIKEANHG